MATKELTVQFETGVYRIMFKLTNWEDPLEGILRISDAGIDIVRRDGSEKARFHRFTGSRPLQWVLTWLALAMDQSVPIHLSDVQWSQNEGSTSCLRICPSWPADYVILIYSLESLGIDALKDALDAYFGGRVLWGADVCERNE